MSAEDIHALSGAYALDALAPSERASFEEHLAACPACRAEVDELTDVAAALGAATPEVPPPALRASVLEAIDLVRPLPPLTGTGSDVSATTDAGPSAEGPSAPVVEPLRWRSRRILAVAAALVLLAAGALVVTRWQAGSTATTAASVLDAPDAQRFSRQLDGFSATVVVSADLDRAVIVSDDMPPAPDGTSYQLWFDRPGQGMTDAGLMPPTEGAQEVLLTGDVGDATAVGVTVEPAGGSPEPTSDPVAVIALT